MVAESVPKVLQEIVSRQTTLFCLVDSELIILPNGQNTKFERGLLVPNWPPIELVPGTGYFFCLKEKTQVGENWYLEGRLGAVEYGAAGGD